MTIPTVSIYRCPECSKVGKAKQWLFDPCDDLVCGDCGEQVKWDSLKDATFISVAMYDITNQYGGPEEGGWYYQLGERMDETLRCYEAGDWPQAKLYFDQLMEEVKAAQSELGRRYGQPRFHPRYYCDEVAPEQFPAVKPVYC